MSSVKTKTVKTVLSVLWWCAIALIAVLMLRIIIAKAKGEVPSVFGYSVINIVTGSMEDEIPAGSYILIKKTKPEKVKCGDVICFYSDDPAIYGMPNTHRVVEEPINKDGCIEFVTRGDANPKNDDCNARGERLIGVYVKRLDGLTKFADALDGGGMLIIIITLQVLIFGFVAVSMVIKAKSEPAEGKPDSEERTED